MATIANDIGTHVGDAALKVAKITVAELDAISTLSDVVWADAAMPT
ncbi:MAG: hypothetical protein AAFX01_08900 [Cyanobacteria bacterium J06638_28]